ncbi:hypothetical protein SDC9_88995 [bioreactor metagenome]|uniref:HTH araC/xylS-type domain-containing protein n=1 Tax=bioreactor metagenome TaxID=1076179 RepID=A0A644ZN15_9ZZZZ
MITNNIYPPRNVLAEEYIKHCAVIDLSNLPPQTIKITVPPLGFPVLFFNYGKKTDFWKFYNGADNIQSVFVGQFTRHITLYPDKDLKLIGVNFKPYGLYNLFGNFKKNILNNYIDASILFGKENIQNIINILQTQDIDKAVNAIENLLLEYQNKTILKYPYFDEIVDTIEKKDGLINYHDLLSNKISERTFQRYFHNVIGVSPKLFCELLRHKYVIKLFYNNYNLSWSDINFENFYYDFSHFSRDFKRFTGHNPKYYLENKHELTNIFVGF